MLPKPFCGPVWKVLMVLPPDFATAAQLMPAWKALDNVTVVAPKPADYPYPQTPWLDVAIETAHVWGCTGTVVGRAARFADAGMPVMRPLLDLIASA